MNYAASDPTVQIPSGPPEGATGEWRVSLAEIDALGRKAARGAGYTWGMAEEAGRAARWLAACELPGPETLLGALQAMDGAVSRHAPQAGPVWRAPAGTLCPIATGAALPDRAVQIRDGVEVSLDPVLFPLLLAALLWRAARDLRFTIVLAAPGLTAAVTPEGPAADWADLDVPQTTGLAVARAEMRPDAVLVHRPDAWPVPVTVWRALDRFAHRTYAPATEASRRAGAGAGLRDTD